MARAQTEGCTDSTIEENQEAHGPVVDGSKSTGQPGAPWIAIPRLLTGTFSLYRASPATAVLVDESTVPLL